MTPFCQRRPDESIPAWHRRVHETAHDWRDVAELMTMRGLHAEAKMVTSVAHLRREERTVALLGVAEERDREAKRLVAMAFDRVDGGPSLITCGPRCMLDGPGPCTCVAPDGLWKLRQRARALRWAAEALMRPEPVWECSGCGTEARGTFPKDWVHVFAGEDVCRACQVKNALMTKATRTEYSPKYDEEKRHAAKGPTAITLADAANKRLGPSAETLSLFEKLCTIEATSRPVDERGRQNTDAWTYADRAHLRETASDVRKRLTDQMIERAGGLARSAVTSIR